jgi:hypothetical protein
LECLFHLEVLQGTGYGSQRRVTTIVFLNLLTYHSGDV